MKVSGICDTIKFSNVERGVRVHRKIYNATYLINVVIQSLLNLLLPMAGMFFIGWLLVSRLSFPEWVYVPLILFGLAIGLTSMIKFILYAMSAFEKIEAVQKAEQAKKEGSDKNTNIKR